MSRVGLGKRLAMAEAAIRTQNPFGYPLHNLDPDKRAKYDRWRAACEKAAGSSDEAGARYAALLDGVTLGPPMPADLHQALRPQAGARHDITENMTHEEAARAYELFLEQGESR